MTESVLPCWSNSTTMKCTGAAIATIAAPGNGKIKEDRGLFFRGILMSAAFPFFILVGVNFWSFFWGSDSDPNEIFSNLGQIIFKEWERLKQHSPGLERERCGKISKHFPRLLCCDCLDCPAAAERQLHLTKTMRKVYSDNFPASEEHQGQCPVSV